MLTSETILLLIGGGCIGFLLGFALAVLFQSQERQYNPFDNFDDED